MRLNKFQIKIVLGVLIASILKIICVYDRSIDQERLKSRKFFSMFRVMDKWMEAKQNGKSMAQGLLKCGYSTVAIYGIHYLCERLVAELKESGVTVLYAIDKNISSSNSGIQVFRPDGTLPQTDVIIVASTIYFYNMKQKMQGKVSCPIISIEEAVDRMC